MTPSTKLLILFFSFIICSTKMSMTTLMMIKLSARRSLMLTVEKICVGPLWYLVF